MDISTQRRGLTTLAGGLLAGAVGAIVWSLSPIDTTATSKSGTSKVNSPKAAVEESVEAGPIANLSLRRPLVDAPQTPKPAVVPRPVNPPVQKSRLELTLVGTMIDSEKSLAIIADSSGKFDVKGVGESLELMPAGVTVQQIDSEEVVLQYRGKDSTFALDKKAKPAAVRQKGKNRGRNR